MVLPRLAPLWSRILFTFVFLLEFTSPLSWAAIEKIPTPPFHSIENFPLDLKKIKPSKNVRALKNAYELLGKQKYVPALALAKPTTTDSLYSDYGYWISAMAHRGLAQSQIEKKHYDAARKHAESSTQLLFQLETRDPYSPFIKSIQKEIASNELLVGDAYTGIKKWSLAESSFERAFQRLQLANGQSLVAPTQILHYATACKKIEGPLCMGWLQKHVHFLYKNTFKNSEEIKTVLKLFPELSDRAKGPKSFGKLSMAYRAPDLDQVAFDAAMSDYSNENYKDSIKSFRKFLEDYPRSQHRFRARYWLAQALTRIDKEPEAIQALYTNLLTETPFSYYGLLAAKASGKPVDGGLRIDNPDTNDTDPGLQPQETIRLRRAKGFLAEKAYELATLELREIRSLERLSSPFLVYAATLNYNARNFRQCFSIVGELLQRGYQGILSPYGLKLIFPNHHYKLIKDYADQNGLDPILVLSLVKQESAFDHEANSTAGALGLMQLMPATAAEMDPKISLTKLKDAENNIRVGTLYFKKLLARFNGNVVLALAAYNAGPYTVDKWVKAFSPKKDMFDFVEAIPYRETREYVSSIIRNYYWYSRGGKAGSAPDLDIPVKLESLWKSEALAPRRTGKPG